MKNAEVFDKAADLIEERGWWNGRDARFMYRGGSVSIFMPICAAQAIYYAVAPAKEQCGPYAQAFARHIGIPNHSFIPDWNDRQTKDIVVAAFRSAAMLERVKERASNSKLRHEQSEESVV